MEGFSHESATSSPKKMIAPRLDCPICHSNAHVLNLLNFYTLGMFLALPGRPDIA
jgi:hypothetical protein